MPSKNWEAKLQQSPAVPTDNIENYSLPRHRLKRSLESLQKTPLVLVACGSYSPVTYLHLRMFEMAKDYILDTNVFEIIGG